MTNGHIPERGEAEWVVGEQTYVLALPLRQLRALDKELACGGVLKLMAPGTRGVFDASITDVALIIKYGLVGGGHTVTEAAFEALWDTCGMMGMVTVCDNLLSATLKGAPKAGKDALPDPLPDAAPQT